MQQKILTIFEQGVSVTFVIMAVVLVSSGIALWRRKVFVQMILHPYSIVKNGEYYRLFTHDLVHNDLMHLLLNEFMLYLVCANLEENLRQQSPAGSWQFLFIYLSGYFAGVITATIRHRNDFNYSSAGASGSILGCMMGFMIIKPDYVALYLPGYGGLKNSYAGLIFILILIVYQRKRNNMLMNHELHFLGALGGIAATYILFPQLL